MTSLIFSPTRLTLVFVVPSQDDTSIQTIGYEGTLFLTGMGNVCPFDMTASGVYGNWTPFLMHCLHLAAVRYNFLKALL